MRFVGRFIGCLALAALAVPALAPAQAVKREALVGKWRGQVQGLEGDRQLKGFPGDKALPGNREPTLLVLWPDGLWYYENRSHGHGRWRLAGDTLWLGDDWRYGRGGIFQRTVSPKWEVVDTLQMPWFMKYLRNDPHFWVADTKERTQFYRTFYQQLSPGDQTDDQVILVNGANRMGMSEAGFRRELRKGPPYWNLSAYRIKLKGHRLTLERLDGLSNNRWLPPKWVLDYQGNFLQPGDPRQSIH